MKAVTIPAQRPVFTREEIINTAEMAPDQESKRTGSGNRSVVHIASGGDAGAAIGLCEEHGELPARRVRVHDVPALDDEVWNSLNIK